jgi:hypothetical protein
VLELLLLRLTTNERLTWRMVSLKEAFRWSGHICLTMSLLLVLLLLLLTLTLITFTTAKSLTWQDGAAEWRRLDGLVLSV